MSDLRLNNILEQWWEMSKLIPDGWRLADLVVLKSDPLRAKTVRQSAGEGLDIDCINLGGRDLLVWMAITSEGGNTRFLLVSDINRFDRAAGSTATLDLNEPGVLQICLVAQDGHAEILSNPGNSIGWAPEEAEKARKLLG